MPNAPSSLSQSPQTTVALHRLPLSENRALREALNRIDNDSRFSSKIPVVTSYDDYHYDDCGYDDAPW